MERVKNAWDEMQQEIAMVRYIMGKKEETTMRQTNLYDELMEEEEAMKMITEKKLPFALAGESVRYVSHRTRFDKINANIKDVIFNDPATIILWNDGSKTVVKCSEDDDFDPEKGFAMALVKKICGNDNSFHKLFKKWMPKTVALLDWLAALVGKLNMDLDDVSKNAHERTEENSD